MNSKQDKTLKPNKIFLFILFLYFVDDRASGMRKGNNHLLSHGAKLHQGWRLWIAINNIAVNLADKKLIPFCSQHYPLKWVYVVYSVFN